MYINRQSEKVFLVDVDPLGPMTDSLLFGWDEILEGIVMPMRVITSRSEAAQATPFAFNQYPKEMIDFSQGSNLVEFAEKFQSEMAKATGDPDLNN